MLPPMYVQISVVYLTELVRIHRWCSTAEANDCKTSHAS